MLVTFTSSQLTSFGVRCLSFSRALQVPAREATMIFVYYYFWRFVTLDRCPLSIFCSRGTPLREDIYWIIVLEIRQKSAILPRCPRKTRLLRCLSPARPLPVRYRTMRIPEPPSPAQLLRDHPPPPTVWDLSFVDKAVVKRTRNKQDAQDQRLTLAFR